MTMKTTDLLGGSARGAAAIALAAATAAGALRPTETNAYITEVFRLAPIVGLDPAIIVAQAVHETDFFRSYWWEARLNPAGIGITGDTAQNEASRVWATGTDSARSHIAHLLLYVTGRIDRGGLTVADDPRYAAYVAAYGNTAVATTIADLSTKWAVGADYADGICRRGNAVFPNLADSPPIVKDDTPMTTTPLTLDWSDLSFPMNVKFVDPTHTDQRPGIRQVPLWINIHETANTNIGAGAVMHSNWMDNFCPGGAEKQVGVHFFVDDHIGFQKLPFNEVSWNAGCGACEGNYAAISIEICVNSDGVYMTTLDNTARLVAKLCKELSIPLSRIVIHKYWSGKWCPAIMLNQGKWAYFFDLVQHYYDALITPVPTPAPAPKPSIYGPAQVVALPDGTAWDGLHDFDVNGVIFHGDVRRVTATRDNVECHQWATFDSLFTRGPLAKDAEFGVIGWVNGEEKDGERRWWITKAGTRIWVGDTDENPALDIPDDPADNPVIPGVPSGPKVVDGVRYYFIGAEGEGRDITVVTSKANVRKYPRLDAPVTRVVVNGAVEHATHWSIGETVGEENVWWRLSTGEYLGAYCTAQRPM